MYYFLNFSIFTKKKYFYGSGYPRIIEYRDGYPNLDIQKPRIRIRILNPQIRRIRVS